MCQRLFTGQCICSCLLCLPRQHTRSMVDRHCESRRYLTVSRMVCSYRRRSVLGSSRSTNTQPTMSLQIYLLSHDQLQISEQYRMFSRQGFLIRSASLYIAKQSRKLLTWEDDNRNSIKPSDTSVLHFDCYVTIYLNVY